MGGESGTDSDRVYNGIRYFIYSHKGVLSNHVIQLAHVEMDGVLVFRLSWGSLNNLLYGCLWFTCNSEGSTTHGGGFGMSRVATVRGRQVDGDAAIVTEGLEVAALLFLLGELAIHPNAWVSATGH